MMTSFNCNYQNAFRCNLRYARAILHKSNDVIVQMSYYNGYTHKINIGFYELKLIIKGIFHDEGLTL